MKRINLTQQKSEHVLAEGMRHFLQLQEYKNITDFALNDITLADDVSADTAKVDLIQHPYLAEPLRALQLQPGKRKEIVIAFPQQMGKSLLSLLALAHAITYNKLQAIVVFPSQALAFQTSVTKWLPIVKRIKQLEEQLKQPFAVRQDRLKTGNALVYWIGSGAPVVSRSAKLVIADEASIHETPHGINNLEELKKRTRSYDECIQLFISTPRYQQDNFWREYIKGSQGAYYLRCQKCGQLTMKTSDTHNLQFETVYNQELKQYIAVRGSERLICPRCKHEHTEEDRQALITQGGYIHQFPDRIQLSPSFQCGVLASLLAVHSWGNIADIQLASGKQSTIEDMRSYDNSIRGLPYQKREYRRQDVTALEEHIFTEIDPAKIEAVYIAADTQDTFSVVGVFAVDTGGNIFLLQLTRPRYLWLEQDERAVINAENMRNGKPPEITVEDLLDAEYFGIKPLCLLVDMRGHRSEEIKRFSMRRKQILMYGGTALKWEKWKISDNNNKLFLCDRKKFQADLIFRLYVNKNKNSNYLFLPKDLTDKDYEQILSFQPNTEKRNGGMFENWDCGDKIHDAFDVLLMSIACKEIMLKIYRPERFRIGELRPRVDHKPKAKKVLQNVKRKPLFT